MSTASISELNSAQKAFEKSLAECMRISLGVDWKTAAVPEILKNVWIDKKVKAQGAKVFGFSDDEMDTLSDYFLKKMLLLEMVAIVPGLGAPISAFCVAGYGRFVMQAAYSRAKSPDFFGSECSQHLAYAWGIAEDDMWDGKKAFALFERGGQLQENAQRQKKAKMMGGGGGLKAAPLAAKPPKMSGAATDKVEKSPGTATDLNGMLQTLRKELDRLRKAHPSTDRVVDDAKGAVQALKAAITPGLEDA
jgi:hypothetical protein